MRAWPQPTMRLVPLLAGLAAPLAAQDTTRVTELAPIEVTTSRLETSVPPPVATIEVSADRLQRTPATDPYDLVRRAAGIEVHQQGQGPGFASDAVIRGFTSDHSSDVLLLLDGVPINLPMHGHVEGYADWSVLSPAAAGAIRVIPGPASPLHGDFAFGGVVEAFTAPDARGTTASVGGSSYGDVNGWVRTGTRRPAGGMLAALDTRREQGWRDNADYWLGNGTLRGWRQAGPGRIEGGLLLYGSGWSSPGFVSVARYNAGDLEAAADPSDGGSARRLILHGHWQRPLGELAGIDALLWGQGVRSRVFLNIPEDGALEQSEEYDRRIAVGGQLRLNRQLGAGELAGGVDGRADWGRYDLYQTEGRVRVAPEQRDDADFRSAGAFVRWRDLVGTRLVYDVGGRLDLLDYAALDLLDRGAGRRKESRLVASPKLGARVLLGGGWSLLGSVSRGFRGAVGVIGDPSRPPVTAWAKEVGASLEGGQLQGRLALFRTDVSDERIFDPVTREVSDAGQSVRQGVSLELRWTVRPGIALEAEGTFNDARITGVTEGSAAVVPELSAAPGALPGKPSLHDVPLTPGARVPGVARYFGRAGVDAALTSRVAARVLVRFSGPFTPIGEPSVRTSAYGLVDLGGSVELGRSGATLDLDLLNLLDTRYPELRASGFLNPGAPRTLRAALRFGAQLS